MVSGISLNRKYHVLNTNLVEVIITASTWYSQFKLIPLTAPDHPNPPLPVFVAL